MKKKFIPIIGTISAGKSTFLKAILGINVLETGVTTTTKFVCLIKNSPKLNFYQVIPIYENGIYFSKKGEEFDNEENIKIKIEEINNNLSKNKYQKNEIFYMLEVPIKSINNRELLENCYFMDIPGLNEKDTNYIEDIFSYITLNDILFQIIIFDSTSIGSDNILNIFEELYKLNCLIKENNVFILNKIDLCSDGNIIDTFKEYFYQNFEDEKNHNKIEINLSKNNFIPFNSLLYQAETLVNEEFFFFYFI